MATKITEVISDLSSTIQVLFSDIGKPIKLPISVLAWSPNGKELIFFMCRGKFALYIHLLIQYSQQKSARHPGCQRLRNH
jgi:hypothetical protein